MISQLDQDSSDRIRRMLEQNISKQNAHLESMKSLASQTFSSRTRTQPDYDLDETIGQIIAERRTTSYTFHYSAKNQPTMTMNNEHGEISITFQSSNNKTAILAKTICKRSHINRMYKGVVSIDEIYEWLAEESGSDSNAWYGDNDEAKKNRKKFKKDLNDWFRTLNQKITKESNLKQVFKNTDGGYTIDILWK